MQGESNSITNQKRLLEDYAKKHGFDNFRHFTDDGISGTTFERKGFKAMIEEVMFVEKGVRFIAINNNIDSANQTDSDFTSFLNIMNEWYARDASRKINAVFASRMESGLRCSGAIPYGYYRKPDDKQTLYVDEESAKVVRRIFDMVVKGYSYAEIAKIFSEEKVLCPTEYNRQHYPEDCRHKPMDDPYRWSSTTLAYIIHRQEYLGHTVLKKSKSLSYKSKKRVKVADEDKIVFKNTHEAVVDEETWKIANRVKAYRKKTPYSVDPLNLTGLLYCADCGAKLIRRDFNPKDKEKADCDQAYCCGKYRQITSDCTMHFIKRSDVLELIKKSIQRAGKYTITNEKEFREQILAELAVRQEVDTFKNAEVIANAEARMKELDTLIGKLYETYALEKISDRQYQRLMNQYEDEYGELEAMVEELARMKRNRHRRVLWIPLLHWQRNMQILRNSHRL